MLGKLGVSRNAHLKIEIREERRVWMNVVGVRGWLGVGGHGVGAGMSPVEGAIANPYYRRHNWE